MKSKHAIRTYKTCEIQTFLSRKSLRYPNCGINKKTICLAWPLRLTNRKRLVNIALPKYHLYFIAFSESVPTN